MMRLCVPQRQRLGARGGAHIGFGRMRHAVEQCLGGHDHAVDAVAALRRLLVDEGLLQRMRLVDGAEALDGGDLLLADVLDGAHAGARRHAVDQNRAGAALLEPAAELGAIEGEIVAQHVEQGRIGLGGDRVYDPVDLEADGHWQSSQARRLQRRHRVRFAASCVAAARSSRPLLAVFHRAGRSPCAHIARVSARKSSKRQAAMALRIPAISSW